MANIDKTFHPFQAKAWNTSAWVQVLGLAFTLATGAAHAEILECSTGGTTFRDPSPEAVLYRSWWEFIGQNYRTPPFPSSTYANVPARLVQPPTARAWGLRYESEALWNTWNAAGEVIAQEWVPHDVVDCIESATVSIEGASTVRTAPTEINVPQSVKLISYQGRPLSSVRVTVRTGMGATFSGQTGQDGILQFSYRPPQFATTAKLIVTCDNYCVETEKRIAVIAPEDQTCPVGNPIQPGTGQKIKTETDWIDSGLHPLSLARHYSSAGELPVAGLGPNWTHGYAASLETAADGQGRTIRLGTKERFLFTRSSGGVWQSDSGVDQLVDNTSGSLFARASDETQWQFDHEGRLISVRERNGWVRIYAYAQNRLLSVTNAFGRQLVFSYDAQGRLISVLTPDAQRIGYGHNAQGALSTVVHTDAATTNYVYEDTRWPFALTGLVNALGQRLETYTYDSQGRATSTTRSGGADRFEISYGAIGGSGDGFVDASSPQASQISVQVKDPLGKWRMYRYQGGGSTLSLQSTDAARGGDSVAARTLGPAGLPTSETDFLGNLTTFSWDLSRQLLRSSTVAANKSEAQTVLTEWHPHFRLPTLITEAGRTRAFTYDTQGNKLTETVNGHQLTGAHTWQWTYDTKGLVATFTDPLGHVTRYQHDSLGNMTGFINPLGQTTLLGHDAGGRIISVTAPNGVRTTFAYDPAGRMVSRATLAAAPDVAPEVDRFTYAATGLLARAVLANGQTLDYTYDVAQRLTGVVDNFGNATTFTLDGMGNRVRTAIRDAGGKLAYAQDRVINLLNRVQSVSNESGNGTIIDYDANGEPVKHWRGEGISTSTVLDGLRRPVAQQLSDGATSTLSYNGLNQVTRATDPKGVQTSYVVDAMGSVRATASPDAGAATSEFDAVGNLAQTTNALGQTTRYTYDALNRLNGIDWADGQRARFIWDGNGTAVGKIDRIEDAQGTTQFAYDGFGRVASKTQTLKNGATHTLRYTWGSGGQLLRMVYPSGRAVTYQREADHVTGIDIDGTQFVTNVAYSALGQPVSWSWASGDSAQRNFDADGRMQSNEFATYGFDSADRITTIAQKLYMPTGTNTFALGQANYQIQYDSHSRIVGMTRDLQTGPPPGEDFADSPGADRAAAPVASAANSPTARFGEQETFSYDLNGNRTRMVHVLRLINPNNGKLGARITTQRDFAIGADSNRLLGFAQTIAQSNAKDVTQSSATLGANYALDAAGNHLGDSLKRLEHDASGRLAKASWGFADQRQSVLYLHNALGQRVFKSEPLSDQADPDPELVGQSFYDWLMSRFAWLFTSTKKNDRTKLGTAFMYAQAGELLGEYGTGGARSTGSTEYIYLPADSGTVLVGANINGQLHAVHTDHLNTPRLMTDAANAPVWQWAYSAFGANEPSVAARNFKDRSWAFAKGEIRDLTDGTDDADNGPQFGKKMVKLNLRYPGQYFDDETNLHYNYFRSYNPKTGRFVQSDPIGLRGGLNPYAYVEGNPLMFTDPMGLMGQGSGANGGGSRAPTSHDYEWKVFRCMGDCSAQTMQELRCNPAPGVYPKRPTNTGDVNNVSLAGYTLGPITTAVSSTSNTTWNLTMPGHLLHPGWVKREVMFDGSATWVVNTGGGDGFNPLNLNSILAPVVWGGQNPLKDTGNGCSCSR